MGAPTPFFDEILREDLIQAPIAGACEGFQLKHGCNIALKQSRLDAREPRLGKAAASSGKPATAGFVAPSLRGRGYAEEGGGGENGEAEGEFEGDAGLQEDALSRAGRRAPQAGLGHEAIVRG